MTSGNKETKVLAIGFNLKYPRNKVLLNAFESRASMEYLELNEDNWSNLSLFNLLLRRGKMKDLIFLIQPAQRLLPTVLTYKFIFRKKIIFDAFFSFYDTFVNDRKLVHKFSLKALYYYLLDYLAARFSDVIIFDTEGHQSYFRKHIGMSNNNNSVVLPVSVDIDLIDDIKKKNGSRNKFNNAKFNVLFYGNYSPLQGVEYIVEAAELLRNHNDIMFTLIGNGQTRKMIEKKICNLNIINVKLLDKISYEKLIQYVISADVCLGIFGQSKKAGRVIANKVLESMSAGNIVITSRNDELEKYFNDNEEIIYCQGADADSLAQKILEVKENYDKLGLLKERAYEKVLTNFSKDSLKEIIRNKSDILKLSRI